MKGKELSWTGQFEEFAREIMEEHDIPGLSVALSGPEEVLYARGFGHRDKESDSPATPETTYGMASITKSFAAACTTMLEEEGTLSSMDPVIRYLPEFWVTGGVEDAAMNLGHFMSHTSALPPTAALRYAMVRSMRGDPSVEELKKSGSWEHYIDREPIDDYDDLLKYLKEADLTLLGRPGEQFSYSNDAYALLGAIIERVSGRSFPDFASERILSPLGMKRSTFSLDFLKERDDVATLYAKDAEGEVYRAPQWQDAPAMVAAGFLRSTVLDMVKYGRMYLSGGTTPSGRRLLSEMGIRRMRGGVFPSARKQYYGRGFTTRPAYHGATLVEHGGSLKGVSSHFGFVPERSLTAAVVANIQGVPVAKLWLALTNLAMDLPMEEARSIEPEYSVSREQLLRYVGVYRSGEGTEIEVRLDCEGLYAEVEGTRYDLRPSGPDTVAIWYRGQETGVRFIPGPDGEVKALYYGLRIIPRVGD
ncbi:MAG: serine hydrolase [Bacillota bacterium]